MIQLHNRRVVKKLQVHRMRVAAIWLSRKENVVTQLSFYADHQGDRQQTAFGQPPSVGATAKRGDEKDGSAGGWNYTRAE